jgi:hypothetical protein
LIPARCNPFGEEPTWYSSAEESLYSLTDVFGTPARITSWPPSRTSTIGRRRLRGIARGTSKRANCSLVLGGKCCDFGRINLPTTSRRSLSERSTRRIAVVLSLRVMTPLSDRGRSCVPRRAGVHDRRMLRSRGLTPASRTLVRYHCFRSPLIHPGCKVSLPVQRQQGALRWHLGRVQPAAREGFLWRW